MTLWKTDRHLQEELPAGWDGSQNKKHRKKMMNAAWLCLCDIMKQVIALWEHDGA